MRMFSGNRQADKAQVGGLWSTVGLAFFLPIAPAPANLFYLMAVVFAVASPGSRQRMAASFRSPATMALVAMYLLMVLWILAGPLDLQEASRPLTKYLEWLFIPVLASLFATPQQRALPILGFLVSMGLTLILSFGFWFGLMDWWPWLTDFHSAQDRLNNAYVFKLHITQNVFMALAAAVVLHVALLRTRGKPVGGVFSHPAFQKGPVLLWLLMGMVGLYNVFFMVEGRTGWLVVAGVLGYWALAFIAGRKGGLLQLLGLGILGLSSCLAAYHFSGFVQDRVDEAIVDVQNWKPAVDQGDSSLGLRMTWWYYSLKAIEQEPVLGSGTGSFERAYTEQAAKAGLPRWDNPHQQFLLFWVEFGLVGLVAFLLALAVIYKNASPDKLDTGHSMRALILAYCAANLFNSLHLDFAEGLFFALAVAVLASRPEEFGS